MNEQELIRVLKALGNQNRLRILEAINESQAPSGSGPEDIASFDIQESDVCCVDEIVGQFHMAQSTISQNLKELHNVGLLERHKKAQWVYYTVNRARFEELVSYLRQFAARRGS